MSSSGSQTWSRESQCVDKRKLPESEGKLPDKCWQAPRAKGLDSAVRKKAIGGLLKAGLFGGFWAVHQRDADSH